MEERKWQFYMMVGVAPDNDGRCTHVVYTNSIEYPYDLVEQFGYDVIDVDEERKIVYMDTGDE